MSALPPPMGGPVLPVHVLHVREGQPVRVHFLENPRGVIEHRYRDKNTPCRGDLNCQRDIHRAGELFYAYAAGEVWNQRDQVWEKWVIRVPSNLHHHIKNRNVVGEIWLLSRRPHKGKKGEVVGVYEETFPPEFIGKPFDVRDVLTRLWGTNDYVLGVDNPMPPPLALAPAHRRAPAKAVVPIRNPDPDPAEVAEPETREQVQEFYPPDMMDSPDLSSTERSKRAGRRREYRDAHKKAQGK